MRQWLPGGGRFRSGRFRDAQGAGRGNDPRFRDRWRIAGGAEVWALGAEDEYFAGRRIYNIKAVPGTDDVCAGCAEAATFPFMRISESGGGSSVWDSSYTNVRQVQARPSVAFGGDYVMVSTRNSTLNWVFKFGLADGVEDWHFDPSLTTTIAELAMQSDGGLWILTSGAANGLQYIDSTATGSAPSSTNYTVADVTGSVAGMAMSVDESSLFIATDNEELLVYTLATKPGSGAWAADVTVDLTATPGWSTIAADFGFSAPCPVDTDQVWFGTIYSPIVAKFDGSGAVTAGVDIETDTGLTGVGLVALDVATHTDGRLYVLGNYSSTETVIVEYDSAGSYITSSIDQSLGDLSDPTPTNYASITVTPLSRKIAMGSAKGYVRYISTQ